MKVRLPLVLIELLAILALFAPCAHSVPSANGPTGLWNVPSAVAMPQYRYNLFVNRLDLDEELVRFGANLGTGLDTPVEIGVATSDQADHSTTFFNIKFQATHETEKEPSVAVGAIDLTKEGDRTFYLVVSKRLDVPEKGKKPRPILASVGAGANKSDAVLDGIFFGIAYEMSKTSVIQVEFDAEDLNIGLRHHISDNSVLDVASVNNRLFLAFSHNVWR